MKEYRDLYTYIFRNTGTVELMDKFEGYDDVDSKPYDRMIISNKKCGRSKDGERFLYSLIVERKPRKVAPIGDITFTEFKTGKTCDLQKYIENSVNKSIINEYSGKWKSFQLKDCFRLRAQNRLNRTGYGWIWDWTDGYGDYTEGTYYGETTEYYFSGIYIF